MKWYKKIGLLATTGLALFGLGACSNDGKSADGTVTIAVSYTHLTLPTN